MTAPESTADVAVPAASRSRRRPWVYAVAVLLLMAHFGLAVGSKRASSTTWDELAHLTAGFSYWENHDYRLHPENGILPQRWAALPAWLEGATFAPLAGNDYWRTSNVWVVGHQFFYETGEDHFPRLMRGRAMIALFSIGTGVLIFMWSRRIFGDLGGLISLTLFAFSPDFLAHGALITSDGCMVFFFVAAVTAWWAHLHDRRFRFWFLSALTFGLAFVAKYSAVLLGPMMVAMAVIRASAFAPLHIGPWSWSTRGGKLGAAALSALGHVVVIAGIIWAFYGFRYAALNPELPPADHFIRPWSDYMGRTGVLGELARRLAALRVLPEAFLYGFDYVLESAAWRAAFLRGEYSDTGWPSFFIWTFLMKSTIPVLLITAGLIFGCVRLGWRRRAGLVKLYAVTPLLVLFVIYWGASITSHLNIGHRHILPIYPVIFIGAGMMATWLTRDRIVCIAAVVILIAGQIAESLLITPYHLAYFNAFAGGPRNGWRQLVDSSLDWGQDLPALESWLDTNAPAERAYLAYFGNGSPGYYQIRASVTADFNHFKFPPHYVKYEAGIYCVSATILQQVYTPAGRTWSAALEKEYQQLRALENVFAAFSTDGEERERLLKQSPLETWHTAIQRHEMLRMARLAHYLRLRAPDGFAGYSILIFRLTGEEVAAATAGNLAQWYAAMEKASTAAR